jgi:serine/threonine protein kinase
MITATDELGPDFAGRYKIEGKIGQGGMGAVYRALDTQLERPVALKVLIDSVADQPAARTRFHNEISVTASLTHPYIVPVYEGGVEEGRFYFTMELIEGSDLGQLCSSEPMDPERAVRLLLQICGALKFIHQKGYVHRDIKPTNVLVWEPGDEWESAKLADFGIVRMLCEDSQLTKAPPGSPPYMPPESVEWQPPTPRSDQYSLGVMAFEMLCGRRPFADEAVPKAHCDQPVPELAELAPGLPAHLCKAVERAMSKVPGDRFEDVAAFAAALKPPTAMPPKQAADEGAPAPPVALVDEIAAVVGAGGKWMQIEEITRLVNARARYRQEVTDADVERRTKTFPRRFRRRGSAVQLR